MAAIGKACVNHLGRLRLLATSSALASYSCLPACLLLFVMAVSGKLSMYSISHSRAEGGRDEGEKRTAAAPDQSEQVWYFVTQLSFLCLFVSPSHGGCSHKGPPILGQRLGSRTQRARALSKADVMYSTVRLSLPRSVVVMAVSKSKLSSVRRGFIGASLVGRRHRHLIP